jgi:FkbM family methyltransferase
MEIPVLLLLCALLVAACGLLYRSFLQNGRTLLRLQALERQLADPISKEEMVARWQRLFHPFAVNNQYDLENIVANVVHQDEYRIAQKAFEPGDVILDVGANIGVFSLLCHVLGSRAIFCYEPASRNFELLKTNVGSLPGVHIFHAAVWRSDGSEENELTLSEGPHSGSHSVLATGHVLDFAAQVLLDARVPAYPVSSVALDAILKRFNRVKLLKLDCEGSEFPILLTSRLLDRVERIVGEVHEQGEGFMKELDPRALIPGYPAYRLEDLTARLESLGFHVSTRSGDKHMYVFDARRREP